MNRKVRLLSNIQAPNSAPGASRTYLFIYTGYLDLNMKSKEIPGLGILVIFSFVGYLAANTVRGPVVLSPRFTAGT
jgi:hypothetical protein